MKVKFTYTILLALFIFQYSTGQISATKNSIGISLIQLQPKYSVRSFRIPNIFHIGLSYERKLNNWVAIGIEGMYKTGTDRVGCIDCPGASGTMNEWNIKLGTNFYFPINNKITLFAQFQLFHERLRVLEGKANFSVTGNILSDWQRKVNYSGAELSLGAEYKLSEVIVLFLNPSIQFGNLFETNSFWDPLPTTMLNLAILENLGIRCKF